MTRKVGQELEARVLNLIKKHDGVTQSFIAHKLEEPGRLIRQVLRRLRRNHRLFVALESSQDKKRLIRVYRSKGG